ncbi:MAG: riboflavin synthase [Planctomycetota bacterium]
MFTGVIRQIGVVSGVLPLAGGKLRLEVDPAGWSHRPGMGDSIAVNGCCLTVVETKAGGVLAFDAVPETLAKTTLGTLEPGRRVHIEQAMSASTLLDGHVVQGHVDGATVVEQIQQGGDWRVRLRPPSDLMAFIIPKGSVTLDGVSLTVADVSPKEGWFEVALIPATLELTTLGEWKPGTRVNLECDAMAKTVVHYLRHYAERSNP